MQQGKQWSETSRHVAVAVIYAIGFMALRQVSFSHWVLFAGFRLSALLLVPYRYWPALLVGEMGPLAFKALSYADDYGATWACLVMLPPIAVAMPIVRWCREELGLFQSTSAVNLTTLMLCMVTVSAVWTLIDMAIVSTARLPPGYPPLQFPVLAARWFIGNFLGVLTLAPLLLMAREKVRLVQSESTAQLWRRIISSRLFLETASVLLPSLALLAWLASGSRQEPLQQAARVAMFLPVIWLSLRHGWHGAALGGTFASVAVVLTMPEKYDAGTLQAQVFIAFTVTTMLLLGERIAALSTRELQQKTDARLALAVAQRNMVLGEMQLRQTSHALEHLREAVHATYGQLLDRLRYALPTPDERAYRLHAAMTQQQLFRLADSLHPVFWGEEGLPTALRRGSLARILDECGIRYWCEVRDRGVDNLSPALQIALYRLACDAIASLCATGNINGISVHLRAGIHDGRAWSVLRVESELGIERRGYIQREELLLQLSFSGLGVDTIKDRVALFEGRMRERSSSESRSISLILRDTGTIGQGESGR